MGNVGLKLDQAEGGRREDCFHVDVGFVLEDTHLAASVVNVALQRELCKKKYRSHHLCTVSL